MNKDLEILKNLLKDLINNYEKMTKIAEEERISLINVDSDRMMEIIQEKQQIINSLTYIEEKLRVILDSYGVENINEFLFFASANNFVDDIRILNGKLKAKIKEFKIKDEINRMIAQEHLKFFNGLLNIYASIFSKEGYDKNASTNIKAHVMSVRA